jgi:hypothetical protein
MVWQMAGVVIATLCIALVRHLDIHVETRAEQP